MNIYSRLFRNLLVATLNFTLLVTTSMVALAAPGNELSGEIIVSGAMVDGANPSVTLNGENAVSGRTFFSGAVSLRFFNSSNLPKNSFARCKTKAP